MYTTFYEGERIEKLRMLAYRIEKLPSWLNLFPLIRDLRQQAYEAVVAFNVVPPR